MRRKLQREDADEEEEVIGESGRERTNWRKEGRKIGNSVSTAFLLQTFAAIVAGAVSKWRAFEACELVSSEC